jgi:uncharacterized protein (DUF1697 family)
MFQRDFLLNEARKFAEMLARLMGLKAEGLMVEFDQQTDKLLQQEYNTTTERLLALSLDDFRHNIENANYTAEKLNALSQLLYLFAEPFADDDETASLLQKVLIIFDALEKQHHYQSFDNIAKQKFIHQYLIKHVRS